MFEWLELEISAIKTPRFHLVDGPAEGKLQEGVLQSALPLPLAYKEFVLKFGNAKLYRMSCNGYRIGVFAGPREATLNDGTRIYHIGFHDGASVYVKTLSDPSAFPIFEFEEDFEEKVAENFEEWLTLSCKSARNSYGNEKWAGIVRGPEPFTREEEKVIETRELMRWRVLGVDPDGNHMIEVTNTGFGVLSALTIGVRSKNGRLNGAVRLNVGHVRPGQTDVLRTNCYKDLVPPQDVEVFALPNPQPEDRDQYFEFNKS